MKSIIVFTTTSSKKEAKTIAKKLLDKKLAACIQISKIDSLYNWKNRLYDDKELNNNIYKITIINKKIKNIVIPNITNSIYSLENIEDIKISLVKIVDDINQKVTYSIPKDILFSIKKSYGEDFSYGDQIFSVDKLIINKFNGILCDIKSPCNIYIELKSKTSEL